ncbi:MAG: chloride channel protein [Thermomicrobiales bacterium]|nr:chloride channel protein [Thermomicrobiales bacterium]
MLKTVIPEGKGFEGTRYLAKWLVLGTAIGLIAGFGAVIFIRAIGLATDLFLGAIAGYIPPGPFGEGAAPVEAIGRPWLLPVATGLGGLLSGIIVFSLAPEAEGHGTDAAIAAIHFNAGRLRARVAPVKLVASAITIGSGGSGGREGPAAQISATFGSVLATWLGLSAQDRRIAVAAGMGAGIGAIFRAPLGGAVMAAEILYLHDLEVEALIPALIASIVGYSVFGLFEGWEPIFGAQPGLGFENPVTLVSYALLGIVCGLVGLLYAKSFYGIEALFRRVPLPRWVRPALGGLLVGLLGLVVAGAIHTGYGWVQVAMSPELLALPLWLVLALPFAKILATSLSIGSGGSGGIFGPGMVIGAFVGAAFWRVGHGVLPALPASPAPFVIVGMIALFGGIAHAPLAMMLMVGEMTGNLSLLAPAMIAVALSTALVGDATIYRSQLPDRGSAPAHRVRLSFPLLSSLRVRDAMVAFHGGPGPEGASGAEQVPALAPDEGLDDALEQLSTAGVSSAPVVAEGQTIGELKTRDIVAAYKGALSRGVRRSQRLGPESELLEARLDAESPLTGRMLREVAFPGDALVVSILRDGETIFPKGTTLLAAGDRVLLLTDRRGEDAVKRFLEQRTRSGAREGGE